MTACYLKRRLSGICTLLCLLPLLALSQNGIPLKDALKKITTLYGTEFVYDQQLLDNKTTVYPLNKADKPLEEVLKGILYPNNLVFLYIKQNYYSIVSKDRLLETQSAAQNAAATPATVLSPPPSGQRSVNITGMVTDSKGTGLPRASITEKGTNNTVLSGDEGGFQISIKSLGATLVFSSVGFQSREVAVAGRASLAVTLDQTDGSLGEVVVVGYGKQKKVNLTGAVSAINIDEKVSGRTLTNVSSGLAGLLPGLAVQQTSGMAGRSNATLLIRGLGTVNDAGPLIVVDGIPDIDINRLNVNDIESVSVLKDAASASIYGSRASNGVILITTKTGSKKQKTSFNYNGTFGLSQPTNFYNFFSDYPRTMAMEIRSAAAGLSAPAFRYGTVEEWLAKGLIDPRLYPNTNWWDVVFHDHSQIGTHTLSASGGSDKMNFYLSAGLLDQTGLLINNDYNRYNIRFNLDYKLTDKLKVGTRIDGQWSNTNYALENGLTSGSGSGGSFDIRYSVPGILPKDPVTGRWGGAMAYGEDVFARNALSYLSISHKQQARQELNGNLYTEWQPLQGLTLRADYGLRYYNQFLKDYQDPTDEWNFQTGQIAINRISASAGIDNEVLNGYKTILQARVNYSRRLFENHELNLLAAYTEEYWFDRSLSAGRNNRIYPGLTEINAALTTIQRAGGSSSSEGLRSALGRINYVINSKYLLEANARYDGSSKFLPGSQYGFFPSASVGWRFTEESFLRGLKGVLSSGKVRASAGKLGNNSGVGRYEQRETYTLTNYVLNSALAQGFSSTKLINRDFSWEETNLYNIGLDLDFLNGRITAETDVYKKLTKGMIRPSTLSTLLSGYNAPRVNIGEMQNVGIETNITYRTQVGKMNVGASFNASYNRNKLLKWNEFLPKGDVFLNMPYHFIYSYISKGVAQSWEDIANAPFHGQFYSPGDVLYEDLNGDGQITSEDRKAMSNYNRNLPTMQYGLNIFGSWQGLDMSVLFSASTGRKDYWIGPENETNVPTTNRQSFNDFMWYDTWMLDNRTASLPRLRTGSGGSNQTLSTFWLDDMSFLRMKNIQLGYSVPDAYLRRIGVGRLRVYATAENLLTVTSYRGIDPERQGESSDAGNNIHPLMKSYSLGINLGF